MRVWFVHTFFFAFMMTKKKNLSKIILSYAGTFNSMAFEHLMLLKEELASKSNCIVEIVFRNKAMAAFWQQHGYFINDLNDISTIWDRDCVWVNLSLFSKWKPDFLQENDCQNLIPSIATWEDGRWLWKQCEQLFDFNQVVRILAHGNADENEIIQSFRSLDERLKKAMWLRVGQDYGDKTLNVIPLLLCPGEHYEHDVAENESIPKVYRHTLLEYSLFRHALIKQLIKMIEEGDKC